MVGAGHAMDTHCIPITCSLHDPCILVTYSTHFVLLASFSTVSTVVSFFSFFLDSNLAATSITTSSLCRSFLGIATTAHMTTFNAQTGCSLALSLSLDSLGLTKWLDFFLELLLSSVQLLELFTPWRKCASLHVISCNQAAQKISVFNHLVPCLLTNFCQKLDLLCQHLLFLHLASDVGH